MKTNWTQDQIDSANGYQKCDYVHAYTCGNCRQDLIATKDGWICPNCDYTQDWALDWILNWGWKELNPFKGKDI